jgi:hypothetical protein
MPESRTRGLIFGVLVLVCVAVGGAAVLAASRSSGTDATPPAPPTARAALAAAAAKRTPMLIFRSLDRKRPKTFGQLALAGLSGSQTARTLLPLRCDRVHFEAGSGICLARGSGFAAGYRARIFGSDFRVEHELELAGVPSRARVSPDGRVGSTTFFVSGHSYATQGAFSTQTTFIDLASGRKIGDLEHFTVTKDGSKVTARDRNYWGATFGADGDTFYATLSTAKKTYLIKGSLRARTARTIHENVECPSLSPDGTRVAYKKRVGSGTKIWRLYVLNLKTMRDTSLAERRPIDDQVEWLSDDRVLYRVDEEIWTSAADGGGAPARYKTAGESPSVVRWSSDRRRANAAARS